ncbi:MAG: putrescine ABC transporter permease PotI [Caedibacter sp. 37-49]|nr:MAG: putrescine ABC transporter permease PotI [Caedibacter sp. 37-49]
MIFSKKPFLLSLMVFGYAFLYLPILSLIIFSFNKAQSVTKWSEFSLRWYHELFLNKMILNATLLSLKIALMTATISVIIGTVAALVIVRFQSFKGRTFFNGLVTAPLVMPEVITGLALLLFFVVLQQTFGWPKVRGITTITLGHVTLTIAYVLVIVRARLLEFDRQLEEAALDLGARPVTVFFKITLPLILPSIAAGWLLAFTLSLDDVVLASFLSGPGSTTLPMLIFSSVRTGISPVINALATIIVTFVTIGIIIAGWFMHKGSPMKNRKEKVV